MNTLVNTNQKSARAGAALAPPSGENRDAFTLIELAVVVAAIALLAIVALPCVAGTNANSKSFQCLNNLRQLADAWTMYADASNDRIVNLSTYVEGGFNPSPQYGMPWRFDFLNGQQLPAPDKTTKEGWIAGIQQGYKNPRPGVDGPLYGYAPNPKIMHCPADTHAELLFTPNTGAPFCFDSYSGCRYLNGEGHSGNCLFKRSQVLTPSSRWIWIESSDRRGENVGSWWMNIAGISSNGFQGSTFTEAPAAFHVTSAHFNFCDGHAESHKWQEPATVQYANDMMYPPPANADSLWVAQHFAGKQNP